MGQTLSEAVSGGAVPSPDDDDSEAWGTHHEVWTQNGDVTRQADDLRAILVTLEMQLANPMEITYVNDAYRLLSDWTAKHAEDATLQEVLNRLEPAGIYPEWRRRALEDAYVLFYEDVVDTSGEGDHFHMPPPPLSYSNVSRPPGRTPGTVQRTFESGSRLWRSERMDYEIRENGKLMVMPASPLPANSGAGPFQRASAMSKGREIVAKGRSTRYCVCASDPVCGLVGAVGISGNQGDDLQALEAARAMGRPPEPRRPAAPSTGNPLEPAPRQLADVLDVNSQATEDSVGAVRRAPRLSRERRDTREPREARDAFRDLVGDWVHEGGVYSIELTAVGLVLHQMVKGSLVEAELVQAGEWLRGDIRDAEDGRRHGQIRLRMVNAVIESNTRFVGRDVWDERTLIARRRNYGSTPGVTDDARPPEPLPKDDPFAPSAPRLMS